jgi:enamine deaminase RidA (YjgF/YER057c/UK114 family)
MSRRLIRSGSPLELEIGFSRAVRVGSHIFIAGTAPIAEGGGVAAPGDVYGQTRRCLEIVAEALSEAGATLDHVARTRMMMVDISHWREAARAHGEFFQNGRPACTFVEVGRFIDPGWLIEIEVDAVIT